jgi:hypothetical protein
LEPVVDLEQVVVVEPVVVHWAADEERAAGTQHPVVDWAVVEDRDYMNVD